MSENLIANIEGISPTTDCDSVDGEEDDLCQPPTTFSVETFSPDDQKLNW